MALGHRKHKMDEPNGNEMYGMGQERDDERETIPKYVNVLNTPNPP
ncbi:MAG: hypothetical protein NPIRA02_19150 [Nitrospirales bacterium]|nr:MAG: hypothetical protein NPIRA02_19150 [Nitrospirales bacterium]